MKRWSLRGGVLIASAIIWLCAVSPALALTLDVDTTGDSAAAAFQACTGAASDCSLRGALIKANAVAGPHTLNVPVGTYVQSILNPTPGVGEDNGMTGDWDIKQNITINGAGLDTVISGDESVAITSRDRIFHVLPAGNLTIRDVSIRRGGRGADFLLFDGGGGILAEGPLTVERSSIRLNQQANGGGLLIANTAVISDSAINSNGSPRGGGIKIEGSSAFTVRIENTTISANSGSFQGGGIFFDVGNVNTVVTVSNVTIATNAAQTGGGIYRAGVGTLAARNTIISGNGASASNPNCFGATVSLGYNLVFGGDTCGFTAGGQNPDIVNTGDPRLGPLQDNGGSTATHALGTFSAALDRGNPLAPGSGGNACIALDQRGLARTLDGDANGTSRCDVGAAEGGRWYPVDTTTDSNDTAFQTCDASLANGNCSLRGAISRANAGASADPNGVPSVITLPATGAGNPYRLTRTGAGEQANATGDFDILTDITVAGGGANTTIIDGNQIDRVFEGSGGGGGVPPIRLRLQDVTVQNGNAGGADGGGIRMSTADMSLLRVRIRGNAASRGGGIALVLTGGLIFDSTISGNTASLSGAGAHLSTDSSFAITNTTIAANISAGGGGGLFTTDGGSDVALKNVTLAGNQAQFGGGLYFIGPATAQNSIVAGNTVTSNPLTANCSTDFTSNGFNLVFGSTNACGFNAGTNDIVNTGDPRLGALQNNGGTTETMALGAGSAAIDKGNTATPGSGGVACGATDQRGTARPVDGDGVSGPRCDIGAHEAASCTTRPNVALGVAPGSSGRISVTVTAGSGNIVELKLHALPATNILVSHNALIDQSGEITIPVNATSKQFTMRRTSGTGSGTLPFDVVDGCGTWGTFAGGGVNAWGNGGSALESGDEPGRTPAPASSPTPTPAPGTPPATGTACATRPRVVLSETPGAPGRITVRVTAGTGNIAELRLHALPNTNILVSIGQLVDRSGELTVPVNAPTAQFTIRRANATGAATLPFDVVDDCGVSATFAGGGASGWGPPEGI